MKINERIFSKLNNLLYTIFKIKLIIFFLESDQAIKVWNFVHLFGISAKNCWFI